jgi:hypothetical protein
LELDETARALARIRTNAIQAWAQAARSTAPRTPQELIVQRRLGSPEEDSRAVAVSMIVDDVVMQLLGRLRDDNLLADEAVDAYAMAMTEAIGDPYVAALDVDLQPRVESAPPVALRRATARCLGLVRPERFPESGDEVVRILEGGQISADARRVRRSLTDAQARVLLPISEEERRTRDVYEAFILSLEPEPIYALTRAIFRLMSSAAATPDEVFRELRASLP